MNPDTLPPNLSSGPPAPRFLRRALRQTSVRLVLLAIVILAAVAGWYVTTRGGWVNALRLPPTLDAATPRAQNGWVLEDIQMPGQHRDFASRAFVGFQHNGVDFQARNGWMLTPDTEDAFGLWLTLPPGSVTGTAPFDSQNNTLGKELTVTARLSTGDTLPLEWHLCSQEQWMRPSETGSQFLFVALPTGYSDDCRFVDFTFSDRHGHTAHWRVTRLPRMRHAVPPPAKVTDSVTENGITMSAKAWRQQDWQSNSSIETILHPILPAHSHQWDVVITRQEHEWEPFGDDGQVVVRPYSGMPIVGRNGIFTDSREQWFGGGVREYGYPDPYPRTTHFLRMSTELRQYETYDEPVAFHNLALTHNEFRYYLKLTAPVSAESPSGVKITLPAQGNVQLHDFTEPSDSLNFVATVQPTIESTPTGHLLPNSPLARTYGKPVQLSLTFPSPYRLGGWSYSQEEQPASYTMYLPHDPKDYSNFLPLPPVLKNFTIVIHQRVDIQTIPMTFTLPITDQSPPYYPKGFRIPKR